MEIIITIIIIIIIIIQHNETHERWCLDHQYRHQRTHLRCDVILSWQRKAILPRLVVCHPLAEVDKPLVTSPAGQTFVSIDRLVPFRKIQGSRFRKRS